MLIILEKAIVILCQLRSAEPEEINESGSEDNPCGRWMEPRNGHSVRHVIVKRNPPAVHRQRHILPAKMGIRWIGPGFRISRIQRKSTGGQTAIHLTRIG